MKSERPLVGDAAIPVLIAPEQVHLWLVHYRCVQDRDLRSSYRTLLSEEERKKQQRFHFAKDRLRYLVTRTLVRTTLSRYLLVDPGNLLFVTNEYGRPEAKNPEARRLGLKFNISHTDDLIVMAVASGRDVGVDVENITLREAPTHAIAQCFAKDEVASLDNTAPDERQRRFFEYWTVKESYIKARGIGLSLPLDKFSFDLTGEQSVSLHIDSELKDHAQRWQFWQFAPTPEYLIALCVERYGSCPTDVTLREVLPGVQEWSLPANHTRISR